jgi:hypothetical protein
MKIIITESQYKKVIKSTIDEAVSYSVAKEYLKIERSPEAEERIKQVFTNLKSLPNARQLDRRGWRISFPYTNDSTENEIKDILEPYQFSVKDYRNNLAIDMKNNREIALNKALNIVSKKEPEAKELIDRYASIKSRGVIDKEEGLMIVFSSAKYDIAGMTTGRNWEKDSCMDLIKGGNKGYVKLDLKEGTIICYLTNINDTNLEKPIGRMLIKPFLNLENSEDVILYPDFKTYGNIPNSEKFIDNIDGYMEKTQKLSGSYRRLGCLYNDNERDEIEGKETIRTRALKKLKNGEDLTDPEFMSLPLMDKRKLIDKMIIDADILHDTQYSFASQSQKKKYISLLIKYNAFDRYNKFEWEKIYKKSTKESKKEIIDYKLRNGTRIDEHELKQASPEQKEEYFKLKLSKGYSLLDWEFEILTPEQKTKAIDVLIKNNHTFTPKEFEHASSTQKETYFERKLTIFKKLIDTLLIDGTPKDSIKSITDQYDIKGYELKFLSPVQKKRYMEIISKFN